MKGDVVRGVDAYFCIRIIFPEMGGTTESVCGRLEVLLAISAGRVWKTYAADATIFFVLFLIFCVAVRNNVLFLRML